MGHGVWARYLTSPFFYSFLSYLLILGGIAKSKTMNKNKTRKPNEIILLSEAEEHVVIGPTENEVGAGTLFFNAFCYYFS